MVLTRRAYKSIIRWLPNEVLTEVMQYASRQDRRALPNFALDQWPGYPPFVSLHGFLYPIGLGIYPLLDERRRGPHSGKMQSCATSFCSENGSYFPPNLRKELTLLLPNFCRLNSLEILSSCAQFPELLRDGFLPNLTTFRCFVHPAQSSLLSSFVNRHPTINQLDFSDGIVPYLDPVQLPNLRFFSAPGSLVPAIVHDNKNVVVMCIFWYVDEPSVDTTLAALGKMASAEKHAFDAHSDRSHQLSFIGAVAENIPDIYVLTCHRLYTEAGRMSIGDALEIGDHLKSYKSLEILEFLDFGEDSEDLSQSKRDDLDLKIVTTGVPCVRHCSKSFSMETCGNTKRLAGLK
ncbi:hypothetical protein B0H11DRAFT_60269 [Mycena galericulata]|nr:hypothetical protein B0H11DRAFT_60269 [Mycena galericulata]